MVFVGDSTFKTEMPDNVTYAGGYIRHIKAKREVVLSQADIDAVIRQIEQLRLQRGLTTNRQHVRHLRQKQTVASPVTPSTTPLTPSAAPSATPQSPKHCPKCGSEMVLRTTKMEKMRAISFGMCNVSGLPWRGTAALNRHPE